MEVQIGTQCPFGIDGLVARCATTLLKAESKIVAASTENLRQACMAVFEVMCVGYEYLWAAFECWKVMAVSTEITVACRNSSSQKTSATGSFLC